MELTKPQQVTQLMVEKFKLERMRSRRDEMVSWLIHAKKFSSGGARRCIDAYLDTLAYVLRETGRLP